MGFRGEVRVRISCRGGGVGGEVGCKTWKDWTERGVGVNICREGGDLSREGGSWGTNKSRGRGVGREVGCKTQKDWIERGRPGFTIIFQTKLIKSFILNNNYLFNT